jgi:hypothetical protein
MFADLNVSHDHEEELRVETMALIEADETLKRRLATIQKAMRIIFVYTIEHTSRSENEAVAQMLGVRLFNSAASSIKLALSGYYQTAFQQARDMMETGFLLDYFRTSPDQIMTWKNADHKTRRKLFDPLQIRQKLDERDGDPSKRRLEQYRKLSELASHATYRGFRMTVHEGFGHLGPFVNKTILQAWLHELVLRLGPSAVMYANQFPDADPRLEQIFREFGTELILDFGKLPKDQMDESVSPQTE